MFPRIRHVAALLSLAAASACGDAETGSESANADELPYAETSVEARAIVALANDRQVGVEELDLAAGLDRRAAAAIVAHRDGPDGAGRSADDDLYDTLSELARAAYVGHRALGALLEYATAQGYLAAEQAKQREPVFSPQPYEASHLPRVAALIDGAEHSLDVAMYSYSDSAIGAALERAAGRGVKIRFVFETANADQGLDGDARSRSPSGRLEQAGVNVRYVNKIMHHKFLIVDGPRDDLERAATARIATGSANWSNSAGTRYDENTLFLTAYPELALRLQAEFNLLWEHSRDFVVDETLPYELSSLAVGEDLIDEHPGTHVWFTSANFAANGSMFSTIGTDTVAAELVAAIRGATQSIHIMSGHLRSRPVSEALMARIAENPALDVRVLLDAQEYIGLTTQRAQEQELAQCVADAATDARRRACLDKGYYFGYEVEQAGALVRYKYYAYRWHYSYAVQMHNKVLIIDGDELYTGSYNLSDNAEHHTMENMFLFRGPEFQTLVAEYEATFERLWEQGRGENLLAQLSERVRTASSIPLVFEPMALTWREVGDLKRLIADNCHELNTPEYRNYPEKHKSCPRR